MGHSGIGGLPTLWWYCAGRMLSTLFLLLNPRFCSSLFGSGNWVFIFIYFWLCWVFAAARGLLFLAVCGLLLLWSRGSGEHGLSRSAAGGIFLDQGSNPCLLHWQVDSLPLSPQGRPTFGLFADHAQACTPLFSVSYSFSEFCCSRRCLSRSKHLSPWPQAPACVSPVPRMEACPQASSCWSPLSPSEAAMDRRLELHQAPAQSDPICISKKPPNYRAPWPGH